MIGSSSTEPTGAAPDLRKARLWEKIVAGGAPPETARQIVESVPPELDALFLGPPPEAAGPPGNPATRILGGGLRTAASGVVSGMQAMGTDPYTFAAQQGVQSVAGNPADRLADRMGVPAPASTGERIAGAGLGGALLGAPFGVAGASGGLMSGGAQQAAAEMHAPIWLQILAGLGGGALGGAGASLTGSRVGTASNAAREMGRAITQTGDQAGPRIEQATAMARSNPTLLGHEALGREGTGVAMRVAREGGTAADPLLNRVSDQAGDLSSQFVNRRDVLAREAVPERQALAQQAADRLVQVGQQARTKFLDTFKAVVPDADRAGGLQLERNLEAAYKPRVNAAYDKIRYRPVTITPELADLLDDPGLRSAYERARLDYNSGVPDPVSGVLTKPVRPIPPLFDENGAIASEAPLAGFDELKKLVQLRGKSLVAEDRSSATQLLKRVDRIIKEHVDIQVPEYEGTRGLFEEWASRRDATQLGRSLAGPERPRTTTRGQVPQRTTEAPDVTEAQWSAMSPAEQADMKLGFAYAAAQRVRRGQPVDFERADFLFTPEEMARIRSAQAVLKTEGKGLLDPQMLQLKQDAASLTARRTAQDPEIGRIQERADAADAVLGAARPQAQSGSVGQARKLLTDVLVGATRLAARDADAALRSKALKPPVRANLANLLSLKGPALVEALQALGTRLERQRTAFRRGMGGAGASMLARPPADSTQP